MWSIVVGNVQFLAKGVEEDGVEFDRERDWELGCKWLVLAYQGDQCIENECTGGGVRGCQTD